MQLSRGGAYVGLFDTNQFHAFIILSSAQPKMVNSL